MQGETNVSNHSMSLRLLSNYETWRFLFHCVVQAADKGLVDMLKSSNLEPNSTYYESIAEKLRAIEANPNWPAERKKVFAKRLVKNLA